MPDTTTASTYHGPVITLVGVLRAIRELEDLPPNYGAPIRLTLAEWNYLADLLGLQSRPPLNHGASSLVGIPIIIVSEGSPVTRFFTLRERIMRSNRLLQLP